MKTFTNFYGTFLCGPDYISLEIQKKPFEYMWDGFLQSIFDKYISKNSEVLEIGSNIGIHTVYLSKIAKHVYALEPQAWIFNQLCGNLFINNCLNVTPLNLAAYDKECQVSPDRTINYLSDFFSPMVQLLVSNSGVRAVTVDSMNLNPDFIKIDSQGADLICLRGAINTIRRKRPVIVLEIESAEFCQNHNHSIEDYYKFFEEIGYNYQEVSPNNILITP